METTSENIMLNLKNVVISDLKHTKLNDEFRKFRGIVDNKMSSYVRLSINKNTRNSLSVLSYMTVPVQNSTDVIDGNDYVSPTVKRCVDYSTFAITKGLMPENGGIKFEFVPHNEHDKPAARQATEMVSALINNQKNLRTTITNWVQDSCLNKNGMLMVKPVREVRHGYQEIEGTKDEIKAFEQFALTKGLKTKRTEFTKVGVNIEAVKKEMAIVNQASTQGANDEALTLHMANTVEGQFDPVALDEFNNSDNGIMGQLSGAQKEALDESIKRNTVYQAKYKTTFTKLDIALDPIEQQYWVCDPTIENIHKQPFCGFYKQMSIPEVLELYPDIDLEKFRSHAQFNSANAFGNASLANTLAVHVRDSVALNGSVLNPNNDVNDTNGGVVSICTVWARYDIDGDDELELVELIVSGDYVISAKEVEFIPVANMCPRKISHNFYGMSIAESVVPMQEYLTNVYRSQMNLGFLQSTPRIGIHPQFVDPETYSDETSSVFYVFDGFDPSKHVYPIPPPSGNLSYLEDSKASLMQDVMSMIGMVSPTDTVNNDIMAPGNSGLKLSLALTPSQLMSDGTIVNAGEAVREMLNIVWKTIVQYGDDFSVSKLAEQCSPEEIRDFIDFKNREDMNFVDDRQVTLYLAVGMLSDENSIQRSSMIKTLQGELWADLNELVSRGHYSEAVYKKIIKPYEDILYRCGINDPDEYLYSLEDIAELQQKYAQAAQAAQAGGPDPEAQKNLSTAALNNAKSIKLAEDTKLERTKIELEQAALLLGKAQAY